MFMMVSRIGTKHSDRHRLSFAARQRPVMTITNVSAVFFRNHKKKGDWVSTVQPTNGTPGYAPPLGHPNGVESGSGGYNAQGVI